MNDILAGTTLLFAGMVSANPIPLPVPASMPLENMIIHIDNNRHATFEGFFTFDFIPADVVKMMFPIPPENATNIHVYQDSVELP